MEEKNNPTQAQQPPGENTRAVTDAQTFDDMLSNKNYQAEFDKRVAKALETAKNKWDDEFEKNLNSKLAEAEKLAKMSAEEKMKFEREKQEKDYNKRVADITKRELKAEAKEQLAENGFPSELAEAIIYTDADSCKASMEAVTKAFGAAVEKAVNERLKRKAPGSSQGNTPDYDAMSDDEYYASKLKK